MTAKVAVIVRTLNRPVLLERAIHSILNQTMRDFVLVVVNDGGEHADVESALTRAGVLDDSRIVVVHNGKNLGRVESIHVGLDAAESDYFVLHDDDDTWAPRFLEVTSAHLDAHPEDGAAATSTEVVVEELAGEEITEVSREWLAQDLSEASLVDMIVRNYIPPIALVVRREALATAGPFDNSLSVLEDWDFNLRLLSHHPVALLTDEPLAFWHQRPGVTEGSNSNSVTAEASEHRRLEGVIRDRYLRRDLEGGGNGLGHRLASAHLYRALEQENVAAHTGAARVADQWGHAHQAHLEEFAQVLQLELGRLRGEVLAVREQLDELRTSLSALEKPERKRGLRR